MTQTAAACICSARERAMRVWQAVTASYESSLQQKYWLPIGQDGMAAADW